jgi:F-type H+-transporting ATPase subunit gamma
MPTIEGMKRKIQSTQDLLSVVKTMKALAAVNIRQYERSVASLREYSKAVEMGLQVAVRDLTEIYAAAETTLSGPLGAVIFGTDQGMAGPLNEQVASHALSTLGEIGVKTENRTILAVGERILGVLEDAGQPVEETISVPGAVTGITPSVQEILMRIEVWGRERGIEQIYLFYCQLTTGTLFSPHGMRLLPVDRQWLLTLRKKTWPTRALPSFSLDRRMLFSALIREYLFVSLFQAFAESLASENASRLSSMQGAERNIEEQLSGLQHQYHQLRQMSITEELLDIIAGFEALNKPASLS